MLKIIIKIALRAISTVSILIIPQLLGVQVAGEIFKINAVLIFVSELTLVHFSIYAHRYLNPSYAGTENFATNKKTITILILISLFATFVLIGIILSGHDKWAHLIFAGFLLCVVYALGRLMIVVSDELYFIIFGEVLPLIFALVTCIVFSTGTVDSFILYKSLASIPYLIWALPIVFKNLFHSHPRLMVNWPYNYLKKYFFPSLFSSLSLPFLNLFVFSQISASNSVVLRLSQALYGPINIFVSNAKAAFIAGRIDGKATRVGFFLTCLYLLSTIPFFLASCFYGELILFNIKLNPSIFMGFYILSFSSFFVFKFVESIVLSTYSVYRIRLAIYQAAISIILAICAKIFPLNSIVASAIFAFYTIFSILIIRKVSQ